MNEAFFKNVRANIHEAVSALLEAARIPENGLLLVGCSTSEIIGQKIGTASSREAAEAVYGGVTSALAGRKIFLTAQCCEHLNRAVVLEAEAAALYGYEHVNAVPKPNAGGAFATLVYESLKAPVVVETVSAHAGLDIGGVLIGMNLARVAVPVRTGVKTAGEANIICARTRPKFIGGERAAYDESIK